jgi:small subunit ribosomal protein S3
MGQKINPLGFRLGTTQDHYSLWFAQPKFFFLGSARRSKNKKLYQKLCTKKYENFFWC